MDLRIVYDDRRGKVGSLGGERALNLLERLRTEFLAKPDEDPGYAIPRFIALSELRGRDPATA